MPGDNYHFDVRSDTREHFDMAMILAFSRGRTAATHYRINEGNLVLLWHAESGSDANPLPYEMGVEAAIPFAWHWLESAEYPREPDVDGSIKKGFRIRNDESWEHVDGDPYGIAVIQPSWQMYGK